MSGEEYQEKGRDGVFRAKYWIEGSTRANVWWTQYDNEIARNKLKITCADGTESSFDFGGIFVGEELHSRQFFAEVKSYSDAGSKLQSMYKVFLSVCYRALILDKSKYDYFLWISWAPGNSGDWKNQATWEYVRDSIKANPSKALDHSTLEPDIEICKEIASKLWIVIFGHRQEELIASKDGKNLIIDQRERMAT